MKIYFYKHCNFPSIEFLLKDKAIIVRYLGGLKFERIVIYSQEKWLRDKIQGGNNE